jgi:hypothetical protein
MLTRHALLPLAVVAVLLGAHPARGATLLFDALPPAVDPVAPGTTVGWGYSLQNLSATHWVVVTQLTAGSVFLHGTQEPNGPIFDFPAVAPGGFAVVPYDGTVPVGLFEFAWDPGAPPGVTNSGFFDIVVDFYDGDPFAGGMRVPDVFDVASAAYSTSTTQGTPAPVPEPIASVLAGLGLGSLIAWRRRHRTGGR